MSAWHGLDLARSFNYRDDASKEEKHQLYRDCYTEVARLLAQWQETKIWWTLGANLMRLRAAITSVVESVGPPPEIAEAFDSAPAQVASSSDTTV